MSMLIKCSAYQDGRKLADIAIAEGRVNELLQKYHMNLEQIFLQIIGCQAPTRP